MSLKDMSKLPLWQPLCLVERNHLCYFGRRHYEEQFCDFFFEFGPVVQKETSFNIFLIWGLGGPFFSGVQPFVQIW